MKLILGAVLIGVAVLLVISSCATVPKPLAPGELRLLSMLVPENENIRVHLPFIVNISFETDDEPEIRAACFYFAADGPHCFRVTDVNYGLRGTIKVQIHTETPGPRFLRGYVLYIRDGKIQPTNTVNSYVTVIPH